MDLILSNELNEIISYSREEAMRMGSYTIGVDHLVLGIIRHQDNSAFEMMTKFKIGYRELKQKIEEQIYKGKILPFDEAEKINLSRGAQSSLKIMYLEAKALKDLKPGPIHLLLAILRSDEGISASLLRDNDLTYENLLRLIRGADPGIPFSTLRQDEEELFSEGEEEEEDNLNRFRTKIAMHKSQTPVLDSFGYDLTDAAAANKLDPIVGRDKEIERLAQILGRRKKNNPVLIGEPGVGKSAIAEGLAIKIANKSVSSALLNKRIIILDIGSIVAGTKYRGQFEERMKVIMLELIKNPNIILFIDELHTLIGAGGASGSLDAANMLKPALAKGQIQVIGATTLDEYRERIEKDGALERRFQKIMVEATNFDETLEILENIKERYEKHHNVKYTREALIACIRLSQRYITDRCLPDKAIDALDETGSRIHLKNLITPTKVVNLELEIKEVKEGKRAAVAEENFLKAEELQTAEKQLYATLEKYIEEWREIDDSDPTVVDENDVAEVLSMITNVPIHKLATKESEKLANLGVNIKKKIIGQDNAVDSIVRAIQRNRAGLKDPNKPIGTFLFLGPTGVGKTKLAKVLTESLFDSEDNIIRIDMSEYMDKFTLSRLIGAPPGYIGYNEGGQLSEKVRRKPYSVVLLDEIEKAHPDIFNLLLQVLDEGRLTDSNGRHIDFRNTLIILTSNIGSREVKDFGAGLGFSTSAKRDLNENTKKIIEKSIKKTFSPEFLNRLDEQILFNTLNKEDLCKIIDIELNDLFQRAEAAGFKIEISDEAKSFVAEEGYDPQFGARPLKRAIQRNIEDLIAEAVVTSKFKYGDNLFIDLQEDDSEPHKKLIVSLRS